MRVKLLWYDLMKSWSKMGAIHCGNDHDMIGIPCQNIGHLMVPSQLRAYFVQSVH